MAILKSSLIVVAVLVVGFLALRVLFTLIANPRVIAEITANPQGQRAGIVMVLTLPFTHVFDYCVSVSLGPRPASCGRGRGRGAGVEKKDSL